MSDYTIRFVCQKNELEVLKKALESYPKNKSITKDFLNLIDYQEMENIKGRRLKVDIIQIK